MLNPLFRRVEVSVFDQDGTFRLARLVGFSTRLPCSGRRSARGFTLSELLVAVALLGVLAVLSWRGMDSVLRGRDRIVSASDDLRSLSVAMTQMEEDLRRSWPIRLLGLPEPPISFSIGATASRRRSGCCARRAGRTRCRCSA